MHLVTRLPIASTNPLLPSIPNKYLRPVGSPDVEPDATNFWWFSEDTPLVDINESLALVPAGAYGIADGVAEVRTSPTTAWSTGALREALVMAYAVVVKPVTLFASGKNTHLCGTLNANAATAESTGMGLRVLNNGATIQLLYRDSSTQAIYTLGASAPADLGADEYLFIAGGRTSTKAFVYIGGVGWTEETLQGPVAASGVRAPCLGNGYSSQSSETAGPYMYDLEFMIDKREYDESMMDGVYARAKARAAWNGRYVR